jgi:serine/threonine protein kinase
MSETTQKVAPSIRSAPLSRDQREAKLDDSDEGITLPRRRNAPQSAPNSAGEWIELDDLIESATSAPIPLVSVPAFPLPKAGDVIGGRYELISHADSGGMGAVYEAWDAQRRMKVAIKFIQGSWPDRDEALNRFRREARALISVYHKNILRVLDFGEAPMPYLVTEWLAGETLASFIEREGRLSPAQAGSMFLQLCAGLSEVHSLGIIHRDIKPTNIFVLAGGMEDRQIRLIDFGLVKKVHVSVTDNSTWGASLTRHGFAPGTPKYMSPEQMLGQSLDHRSDLFSAALVAFKMLTGENAIREGLPIFSGLDYPLPSRDVRGLPAEVDDFFRKALHCDPKHRYSSALEMGIAFKNAMAICHDVGPLAVRNPPVKRLPKNDRQSAPTVREEREQKRETTEAWTKAIRRVSIVPQGGPRRRLQWLVAALCALVPLWLLLLVSWLTDGATGTDLQDPADLAHSNKPPATAPNVDAGDESHSPTLPNSKGNDPAAGQKSTKGDGAQTQEPVPKRSNGTGSGSAVNPKRNQMNRPKTPTVREPGF